MSRDHRLTRIETALLGAGPLEAECAEAVMDAIWPRLGEYVVHERTADLAPLAVEFGASVSTVEYDSPPGFPWALLEDGRAVFSEEPPQGADVAAMVLDPPSEPLVFEQPMTKPDPTPAALPELPEPRPEPLQAEPVESEPRQAVEVEAEEVILRRLRVTAPAPETSHGELLDVLNSAFPGRLRRRWE